MADQLERPRIFLSAGDASGDMYAAWFVEALRERVPEAECFGCAGPRLRDAGCEALLRSESIAMVGLAEVAGQIPRVWRQYRRLVTDTLERRPDLAVLVDAPDFNLGLEKSLRSHGIRTVQYVSPSVWAWRERRVHKVAKAVDKVLCLLPFEKVFYDDHNVGAEFVGHPLADRIKSVSDVDAVRQRLGIEAANVVAVLPGSRRGEVMRLGRDFAEACALLSRQNNELAFIAPMANAAIRDIFQQQVQQAGVTSRFRFLDGDAQSAMAASDVVMLASGTATLEAALIGRPMVAAYRVAPLTYAIAKTFRLLNVEYFTLPNLLTPEPLVKELMQHAATPDALAAATADLLGNPAKRQEIADAFNQLHRDLARNADRNAANAVLQLARQEN